MLVSVDRFNNSRWIQVVTLTYRPKLIRNRCEMEVFGGVFCFELEMYCICWDRGFCQRTKIIAINKKYDNGCQETNFSVTVLKLKNTETDNMKKLHDNCYHILYPSSELSPKKVRCQAPSRTHMLPWHSLPP